jgi:hypothetical protein
LRQFRLVILHRESLQDSEIQLMSDWGSSGFLIFTCPHVPRKTCGHKS